MFLSIKGLGGKRGLWFLVRNTRMTLLSFAPGGSWDYANAFLFLDLFHLLAWLRFCDRMTRHPETMRNARSYYRVSSVSPHATSSVNDPQDALDWNAL